MNDFEVSEGNPKGINRVSEVLKNKLQNELKLQQEKDHVKADTKKKEEKLKGTLGDQHEEKHENAEHAKNTVKVFIDQSLLGNQRVLNATAEYERSLGKGWEALGTAHIVDKVSVHEGEQESAKSITLGAGLVKVLPSINAKVGGFGGLSAIREKAQEIKPHGGTHALHASPEPLPGGKPSHGEMKIGPEFGVVGEWKGPKGLRINGAYEFPTEKYGEMFATFPVWKKLEATGSFDTNNGFAVGGTWKFTEGKRAFLEFIPDDKGLKFGIRIELKKLSR